MKLLDTKRDGRLWALALLQAVLTACANDSPTAPKGGEIVAHASPATIPAADGVSRIDIDVFDDDGDLVRAGVVIRLSSSLGAIEDSVETDGDGHARATLRADGRSGTAKVALFSGSVSEELQVAILEGNGVAVDRLEVTPSAVAAWDGVATVTAHVVDVAGHPIAGAPVSFFVSAGRIVSPAVTGADGWVSVAYAAERAAVGVAVITARAGLASERTVEITLRDSPIEILASADPRELTAADTTQSVQIEAEVVGRAGTAMAGERIRMATDTGVFAGGSRVEIAETDSSGKAVVALALSAAEQAERKAASKPVTITLSPFESNDVPAVELTVTIR